MMFDDFENDEESVAAPEPQSGLQEPRLMSSITGHELVEQQLFDMVDKGRLPHALIFSGLKGIGKSMMAFRLVRHLLAKDGQDSAGVGLFGGEDLPVAPSDKSLFVDPEDRVFRQVASGGHPDFKFIQRPMDEKKGVQKAHIDVATVRQIVPFMRMTASQAGWRVVLVDDADTMNRNAQNAILKVLEEPPPQSVLVLVTHRLGHMIPTIRSRCRVIPFQTPDRTMFGELLAQSEYANLPKGDTDLLYDISGGSFGNGLDIMEEGGLEAITMVVGLLQTWPKWDWPQIHTLAENMGRAGAGQALQVYQDVMLWLVNLFVRSKARGTPLPAQFSGGPVQELYNHYNLNQWSEIYSQLRDHFDMVDAASLDKRQAVLGAFTVLSKEAA